MKGRVMKTDSRYLLVNLYQCFLEYGYGGWWCDNLLAGTYLVPTSCTRIITLFQTWPIFLPK